MYDDSCILIRKEISVSDAGDPVETDRGLTTVFCQVSSATFKEKDAAQARGKRADLTIRLADRMDYADQLFIEYNSEEYEVVDTYYDDRSRELRLVVGKWARQ